MKVHPISNPDQKLNIYINPKPTSSIQKLEITRQQPLTGDLTFGSTLRVKITKNEPNSAARCVNARYLVSSLKK